MKITTAREKDDPIAWTKTQGPLSADGPIHMPPNGWTILTPERRK
ncbi:hypothetical protein [Bacteroides graminisolvens]|nr:hypothetical protein [Bacteroides graminisolvens]